ncbi:hypothetical protein ZWY2020_006904 [Hordeum vulgare]|nr:hypothetical protein ZWY2020_006904 [Hordeum vulgare]
MLTPTDPPLAPPPFTSFLHYPAFSSPPPPASRDPPPPPPPPPPLLSSSRRRARSQRIATKVLAVCNPLAGTYRLLPPLVSTWARHGTVLAGPGGVVLVLTELAALSYSPSEGSGK